MKIYTEKYDQSQIGFNYSFTKTSLSMKTKSRIPRLHFALLLAMLMLAQHTFAQCSFSNGYTGPGGWTTNGSCYPGCYSIGPSSFNFNATPCGGGYNYATMPTPCTINNSCWCADIDFVYTGRTTTGVAHTLLSFTSNTLNSWNVGPTFAVSNNNDIEAYLLCPANGGPNTDAIYGRSKLGTTWNTASTGIPVTAGNTYYIRLQRLSPTQGLISVFSNAARTIQVAGSPQCFPINAGVTGLGILQHGAIPQGSSARQLTGTLSNLAVNDVVPGIFGVPSLNCGRTTTLNLWVNPVCGASNYNWTGPGGFSVTNGQGTPNITATAAWPGTGTVTCTITFPGAACSITHTVNVTITPPPTIMASPSASVCLGSPVTLTASGLYTNWLWAPTGSTSASIVVTPTATTTYTVYGTNPPSGCAGQSSIVVTVNPVPTANAGPDDTTCCGTITYLGGLSGSASGGTPPYTYSWNPTTNFIGCTTCANPPVMDCNGSIVTYTLTVTDANGCTATDAVTIWFSQYPCRMANPNADQNQQGAAAAGDMSIAPNPTNGSFVIAFSGAAMHDVEVADVLGKTVYSKPGVGEASLTIDLSAQPKGVYFVKCREGEKLLVQRIVIQ